MSKADTFLTDWQARDHTALVTFAAVLRDACELTGDAGGEMLDYFAHPDRWANAATLWAILDMPDLGSPAWRRFADGLDRLAIGEPLPTMFQATP